MTGTNQSAVNVTVNKELVISCGVESHPTGQLHWEDNTTVFDTTNNVELEVTANTSVRGAIITYTCVVENIVGGKTRSVNNSITVYVQGKTLQGIQ